MSSEPKHYRISRELLAEITGGKYGPTGRLPSEMQLVQRYGVSRPTVARALRDLQEQGVIARRVGSGSYIRASLGDDASSGGSGGRRPFGLLIPGLGSTEIFEEICGELANLARTRNHGLIWGAGHSEKTENISTAEAERLCDQFIDARVSGVFFSPFEQIANRAEVNQKLAEKLRRAGIAVVLLDRDFGVFPSRSDFDLVGVDNFMGGFLLADHLLDLGCRDLAFVVLPNSASTVGARIAGAREAVLARGLHLHPDFVRVGDPDDPKLARSLLVKKRVDAILCANDRVAALLLRSIEQGGARVPEDVRLVGFDDVRFASLLSVPLTTIHQPLREIAAVAFQAMLDRIATPALPARSLVVSPRLVVRESCGASLAL